MSLDSGWRIYLWGVLSPPQRTPKIIFSETEARYIAGRGARLLERACESHLKAEAVPQSDVDPKLSDWLEALEVSAGAEFNARLGLDNIPQEAAEGMLRTRMWPPELPLPGWVVKLQQIFTDDETLTHTSEPDSAQIEGEPILFEECLVPFIRCARADVLSAAGDRTKALTPDGMVSLERGLLSQLSNLSRLAIGREFYIYRAERSDEDDSAPTTDQKIYADFIAEMLSGAFTNFLCNYSVLARSLVALTENWVESTVEFLQRMDDDKGIIFEQLFEGRDPGVISHVRSGLSDPHHGNRTVLILTYEGGARLVYKPRSLLADMAFQSFVSWFNSQQVMPPMKEVGMLDRTTHGWMEFVAPDPCRSHSEVEQFFENAGAMLCLAYALQGTDLHCENLIASGCHAVFVDMETIMHPRISALLQSYVESSDLRAEDIWVDSVVRTGLLPEWETGQGGHSFDVSGLGCSHRQPTGFPYEVWHNLNSDDLELEWCDGFIDPGNNLPTLDGERVSVDAHNEAVLRGFETAYRLLLQRKDLLLSEATPLKNFSTIDVRFVFRPTSHYLSLLRRLRHDEFLEDGATRTIEIEALSRAFKTPDEGVYNADNWAVYNVEREAIENMDVPHFNCPAGSRDIYAGETLVTKNFFEAPSYDGMMTHLRELSEEDLAAQRGYIQAVLYAHRAEPLQTTPSNELEGFEFMDPSPAPELWLREAEKIADATEASAIWDEGSSANWICLVTDMLSGRLRLQPMGYKLYSGRVGVALFLAALDAVKGESSRRDLMIAAVTSLANQLRTAGSATDLCQRLNLGSGSGVGGILYGLCTTASLSGETQLVEMAGALEEVCSIDKIRADEDFDLISGCAGLIMGLEALYKMAPTAALREKLLACGDHLLEHKVDVGPDRCGWKTPLSPNPLTGISHGAAGIAYALTRLAAVTGEERFLSAATQGMAYERSLYNPEIGNWPDLRDPAETNYLNTWCHGAPGIGIARLASRPWHASDELDAEINAAAQSTLGYGFEGPDHLCCGHLGRANFLWTAGRAFNKPEWTAAAVKRVGAVLQRAKIDGDYNLYAATLNAIPSPSFMQGTSGVGYQLLRFVAPDLLPDVLHFEILPEAPAK